MPTVFLLAALLAAALPRSHSPAMPRYSPAGSFDGLACLLAFALDLLLKGLCLSPVHSFISQSFFFFF